jgi:3-methylcrotonyl-CoA carboxylase alpha subunit
LTHLQLPKTSETVRVDAGFVAGDDISSHYDPMIAKLIVRGPTREVAIQKLHTSLNEYEIAGPVTNIEFLKRVCETPAFVTGDVETGFITKWEEVLFAKDEIQPEVYAQAALGTFILEGIAIHRDSQNTFGNQIGFVPAFQDRQYTLNDRDSTTDPIEATAKIKQLSHGLFNITINETTYPSVTTTYNPQTHIITSYFPHTRLETRFIVDESNITLFHQGNQHRLRIAPPAWIAKALGIQVTAHSVLAPMPCKILRVEVAAGEQVTKDQVLLVIESMKMETVIRSPQDGVVARVVCPAGVSLFFFLIFL